MGPLSRVLRCNVLFQKRRLFLLLIRHRQDLSDSVPGQTCETTIRPSTVPGPRLWLSRRFRILEFRHLTELISGAFMIASRQTRRLLSQLRPFPSRADTWILKDVFLSSTSRLRFRARRHRPSPAVLPLGHPLLGCLRT